MSNKLALAIDEATCLVDLYLYSFLDNLANRDKILCDHWDMQYVLDIPLVIMLTKCHISNVLNCVWGVIIGLHHWVSLVHELDIKS